MKPSILSIAMAAAVLALSPTAGMAQSSEHDAVHRVMQTFIAAYKTDDAGMISDVFRKDGVMIGYAASRGNALLTRTGEEFATGFDGVPADDEAQRTRSYEILDVTGNLAAVKVLLDYPGWDGVDYLVLLKTDGEWMIASKSWTGQPKP